MPRKNCDYSRTVIYKIVCNDLNITDCYVGHTTEFTKEKLNIKVIVIMKSNSHIILKYISL